jgi:integrase
LLSSDDPEAFIRPRAAKIALAQGRSRSLSIQFGALLCDAGLLESKSHLGQGIGRNCRRAVHGLSFHSLRHSMTTWLHDTGAPQGVAQGLVGHESVAVHGGYYTMGRESSASAISKAPEITG